MAPALSLRLVTGWCLSPTLTNGIALTKSPTTISVPPDDRRHSGQVREHHYLLNTGQKHGVTNLACPFLYLKLL